jgi:phosphotransferase system enzyme I (PtsP)
LAGDPGHPLDHPELFLVQLKAMLRASEGLDNLAIMLPMISSVSEIKASRRLLDQAWREVSEEAASRDAVIRYPSLGVMIEVPSALYILPEMAPLIDFWSVGSNDLTQYLLAVDRNNARVASIYDAFHPAVIRACNCWSMPPGAITSRSLFVASWLAIRSVCYCCWPWAIAVSA